MKMTFGPGKAKYRNRDALNSCGTLTLKAETDRERAELAAILRVMSGYRNEKGIFTTLSAAIIRAGEQCQSDEAADSSAAVVSSGAFSY